jgi:hypothetical protein
VPRLPLVEKNGSNNVCFFVIPMPVSLTSSDLHGMFAVILAASQ